MEWNQYVNLDSFQIEQKLNKIRYNTYSTTE